MAWTDAARVMPGRMVFLARRRHQWPRRRWPPPSVPSRDGRRVHPRCGSEWLRRTFYRAGRAFGLALSDPVPTGSGQVGTFPRELKMGGQGKFETRRQKLENRNWKLEKQRAERFLTSAGRPFRLSETGRKSRPASFGMTDGGGALLTGVPDCGQSKGQARFGHTGSRLGIYVRASCPRAYLVAGFEPGLSSWGSPRNGSLNLREISGQNSRSTSKPMS
jgi:hypothetical protein